MRKDTLAAGAKSANFGSMSHIDQKHWDSIFEPEKKSKPSGITTNLKPAKSPRKPKKGQ